MKHNVFVISTEYQFIGALSIIEQFFPKDAFENTLVFTKVRTGDIVIDRLPKHIKVLKFDFYKDSNPKKIIIDFFTGKDVANVSVVQPYRPDNIAFLWLAPKSANRVLQQDGALFYHDTEVNTLFNQLRVSLESIRDLAKKGIFPLWNLFYKKPIEKVPYIHELYLTNPEIFTHQHNGKKLTKFDLFPSVQSLNFKNFFKSLDDFDFSLLTNALFYIAPIIRDDSKYQEEAAEINKIKTILDKKHVFIKLHPNRIVSKQRDVLESVFGKDAIIANFVPAEVYMSQAINSAIVGVASTSLFYNNPKCKIYGLKRYYQKLGVYPAWKNVTLPKHVIPVNELSDFN